MAPDTVCALCSRPIGPREQTRQDPGREEPSGPEIPEDDIAWSVWGVEIEAKIEKAADAATLAEVHHEAQPVLQHASKAIKDRINQKFTDRAADLAAGPDDGAAAGGTGNDAAAGAKA